MDPSQPPKPPLGSFIFDATISSSPNLPDHAFTSDVNLEGSSNASGNASSVLPTRSNPRIISEDTSSNKASSASSAGTSREDMQSIFQGRPGSSGFYEKHSAKVWESRKEEIRRLYLDENMPLKDVITAMEQKGFKAT